MAVLGVLSKILAVAAAAWGGNWLLTCRDFPADFAGDAAGPSYTVALVQHNSGSSCTSDSRDAVAWQREVLGMLEADVQEASSKGAQLLIFPEFAFLSNRWLVSCRSPEDSDPAWCPTVPEAGTVVCPNFEVRTSNSSLTESLACLAKKSNMLLAVNLCETGEGKKWNTQVVFDQRGAVLARYRKAHPFMTRCFEKPATPDHVAVEAPSLGVKLGIFTCYDIVFQEPSNGLYDEGIRHFVYSSAIPVVGGIGKRLWTLRHPGAYLLGSDSGAGMTGLFHNGGRLTPPTGSGERLVLARVPVSSASGVSVAAV